MWYERSECDEGLDEASGGDGKLDEGKNEVG